MRIIPELELSLNEIAAAIGCDSAKYGNSKICAITTDSRLVNPGDLFIALQGEKTTGELFTDEAKSKGAYVISTKKSGVNFTVDDTSIALLRIATFYKMKLKKLRKTVAITGSVGKTTTKNILSGMLSHEYKVHSTHENYNNAIGLSHTILTAPKETEILIAEIGMNHAGEINALSNALAPDLSIITNIGNAHIGNLGSREMIAKAKLEILDGMKIPLLIAPYEEPLLKDKCTYTFSIKNENANFYIKPIHESSYGSVFGIFTDKLKLPSERIFIPGKHILNALAIGVGTMQILGARLEEMSYIISTLESKHTRGSFIQIGRFTVYDDAYSSSPEAVISDFKLLKLWNKKRCCMLGDMLELGERSIELHRFIGKAAYEYGFNKIFAFGKYADEIAFGARSAGMSSDCIFINTDVNAPDITSRMLSENVESDEIILFKASHALHAERIYRLLK